MDPGTILGIVEGSISLAMQCGSVANSLNNLAGQYKYAKLTISTMIQDLDVMQFSWDRIGAWFRDFMPTDNDVFAQRLERFLEIGSLVLDALEVDLRSYNISNMPFTQRSRLLWNENILQGHQNRIRDQAQSMSLLLQAVQLPTSEATTNLLQKSQKQFMKSDESAFSIVPSKLSSRLSLSTGETGRRNSVSSYASMEYRRLGFEDELFTARVYKRNYRNSHLQHQQKINSRIDHENITPHQGGPQDTKEVIKLNLQRFAGGWNISEVSVTRAKEEVPYHPDVLYYDIIMVSKSYSVSSEEIDHDQEHRVGSSNPGVDGLYVKMAPTLEHRISSSASAQYVKLVVTCGIGDNESVKRQLAMMPPTTLKSPEIPALLGSYISGSFYFCPIHAAIFNGHVEVMKTLLRRAALENDLGRVVEKVVGGTENDPWRPLHVATLKGNLSVVRLLLENGASVLNETGYGIQAVHLAARTGSMEILEALFAAGADINCTDLYGRQPLHYISDSHNLPTVIEYLVERGASIHGTHCAGELTPLHIACKKDFSGNLGALLSFGALAGWFPASLLESALDMAIRCDSSSSVQTLLRHGVSPDRCGSNGRTSLHTLLLSPAQSNLPTNSRILRPSPDHVNLLVIGQNGDRVIDTIAQLVPGDLMELFLKNLPRRKVVEKTILELKWVMGI